MRWNDIAVSYLLLNKKFDDEFSFPKLNWTYSTIESTHTPNIRTLYTDYGPEWHFLFMNFWQSINVRRDAVVFCQITFYSPVDVVLVVHLFDKLVAFSLNPVRRIRSSVNRLVFEHLAQFFPVSIFLHEDCDVSHVLPQYKHVVMVT